MANQAIALQARAPQTDILGGAIRNNAQLINSMSQQRTAERQNAMAQQQMQLAQEKSTRDTASFDIDMAGKKIDFYTKRAGQTMNPQGYQLLLQDLDRDAPEIAAAFRTNMPPEQFDRGVLLQMVGSVSDNFKANYGPLETEVVQMEDGTYSVARTGGFGKPGVFELEEFALKPGGAPAAAAAPTAAAPQQGGATAQPSRGANTTPQDLMRQGVNPDSIPSGNPLSPISTGVTAQPDLGAIVQNMMQTGVISQSNMDALNQLAGPQKAQRLAQIMQANNFRVMPDEQAPSAGMRNAVFRPEEGAPAFQQAQSMDDYVATGRAARGKSPMQSPLPGSAQVPLPRVRDEAAAQRPSAKEAYDVELAKERAKYDAAANAPPKRLTPVQEAKLRDNITNDYKSAQSTIDMMAAVRSAVNDVRNLSADQKEAVTGYSAYFPSIYGTTKTADTKIKNLTGKVTEMGKAAASLGGSIGQMAVQEWTIVRDMIAALNVEGMGAKDLDDQLDIIEGASRRAERVTRDAYQNQYVEEFARFPNRFQLREADAPAATRAAPPAGKRPAAPTRTKSGASVSNW